MTSRLLDFLLVLLLIALACSGTSLMIYALWHIGQRIMIAMHTLLTCWEFHAGRDEKRRRLLSDPAMHNILTMQSVFSRVFAPFSGYSSDLVRLKAYRHRRAREQATQMIWDSRLGALLTRDEYEFLYGAGDPPSAGAPVPVPPFQPPHCAAAAG
jgi:hypothetical protein